MRGRQRKVKVKPIRLPKRRYDVANLPRGYAPWRYNDPLVVLEAGPEQSLVRFLVDRTDQFLINDNCLPNTWFKMGRPPRPPRERVRLKTVLRVKLKRKRV